jgi:hypothetical protein
MYAGAKRHTETALDEPPSKKQKTNGDNQQQDDEEDPFEAFMKQINDKASKQKKKAIQKQKAIESKSPNNKSSTHKKEERIDLISETPMDAIIEQT